MGSERATIEDEEKFFSPMQLNSPAQVAMDAGGGQGEPMSQDQRQQFQQAIRGRGPSLFGDLEQIVNQVGADQENDSDDASDDARGSVPSDAASAACFSLVIVVSSVIFLRLRRHSIGSS